MFLLLELLLFPLFLPQARRVVATCRKPQEAQELASLAKEARVELYVARWGGRSGRSRNR